LVSHGFARVQAAQAKKPRLAALITAIGGLVFFSGNFVSYSSGDTIRLSSSIAFGLAAVLLIYVVGVKYFTFRSRRSQSELQKIAIPFVSLVLLGVAFWMCQGLSPRTQMEGSVFGLLSGGQLLKIEKNSALQERLHHEHPDQNFMISIVLMVLLSFLVNRPCRHGDAGGKNKMEAVALMGIQRQFHHLPDLHHRVRRWPEPPAC
jgi:hypothetical protein